MPTTLTKNFVKLRDVEEKKDIVDTFNTLYRYIEEAAAPIEVGVPVTLESAIDLSYSLNPAVKFRVITLITSAALTLTFNDVNCFTSTVIQLHARITNDFTLVLGGINFIFLFVNGSYISTTLVKRASGWYMVSKSQQ